MHSATGASASFWNVSNSQSYGSNNCIKMLKNLLVISHSEQVSIFVLFVPYGWCINQYTVITCYSGCLLSPWSRCDEIVLLSKCKYKACTITLYLHEIRVDRSWVLFVVFQQVCVHSNIVRVQRSLLTSQEKSKRWENESGWL